MTQQTLNEASRALQQGRIADAEKLLRDAIKADPQSIDPHIALGMTLTQKKDHDGATESYANAMRLDRNRKGLALKYAVSCFSANRFDEAEKSARFAVQQQPDAAAYDALACALREQGKAADALAAADQALSLSPSSNAAQHTRGTVLLAMGRTEEALKIFEGLNNRGVSAPAVTLNRGAALEKLGRTAEATRLYTEAATRWPDFPELQRQRSQRRH